MLSIHQSFGVKASDAKGRYSQNGVKFQTLCSKCNNELLGVNYDPHLNFFSSELIKFVESSIELPSVMYVTSKPNLIARAVLGHMLAIDVGRGKKGEALQHIARYFKEPKFTIPNEVDIYYWVYPHRRQVLIRDSAIVQFGSNKIVNFMCLKYFPLAFMATIDSPKLDLPSLNPYLSEYPDQERNIPVELSNRIPRVDFPEAPSDDDHTAILYGKAAMAAFPK